MLVNDERLREAVLACLGRPYMSGPCGEGPQGRFDQRPICRNDAFDCLTYVNFVLAQYFSGSSDAILSCVKQINYSSGEISYFTRCHYMTSDWLPNNINAGRLSWITASLGLKTRTAAQNFDRSWFFAQRTKADLYLLESITNEQEDELLHELQNNGPKGVIPISITYCEWGDLQKNITHLRQNLPPISIMLVVRPSESDARSCGMVSHLGFVLNERDALFFVHAKQRESVQKEKLSEYLARFENHMSIKGASFLQVLP